MNAEGTRPRSIGQILDAAVKVYVGNARTLMGLAAAVVVPLQAVVAVVLLSTVSNSSDVPRTGFGAFTSSSTTSTDPASAAATLVLAVVSILSALLVTAASVKAVSDIYLDQPTGVGVSLRFALRRLPALLVMEILLVLGVTVAFFAVVAPAIWLYVSWAVASAALLIERLGPARALGRSRRLVKGRWWATCGVLIVATLMASVVSGVLQGLLTGLAAIPGHASVVVNVLLLMAATTVSTVVANPFQATVVAMVYYDLRVRKEGYDVQLLAEQLGLPEVAAQAPTVAWAPDAVVGPESVGQPGGPPFWPPPPGWTPSVR